jgi:hypothetical protein
MINDVIHFKRLKSFSYEWMYRINCDSSDTIEEIVEWCCNEFEYDDTIWKYWKGWKSIYMLIAFNDLEYCTIFLYTWDQFND